MPVYELRLESCDADNVINKHIKLFTIDRKRS